METLKMTQALDEKGFLNKKITNQLLNLDLVAVKRESDLDDDYIKSFENKAKADYQSIIDQIDRYNRLTRAIIRANAEAIVEINGIDMTRAEAISLRNQLKEQNNFEKKLLATLRKAKEEADIKNDVLQSDLLNIRERYTSTMISNSVTKDKSSLKDDDFKAIDRLTESYTPKYLDPIDIQRKIDSYGEKYDDLLQKLETAIKISNATTDVSF